MSEAFNETLEDEEWERNKITERGFISQKERKEGRRGRRKKEKEEGEEEGGSLFIRPINLIPKTIMNYI